MMARPVPLFAAVHEPVTGVRRHRTGKEAHMSLWMILLAAASIAGLVFGFIRLSDWILKR